MVARLDIGMCSCGYCNYLRGYNEAYALEEGTQGTVEPETQAVDAGWLSRIFALWRRLYA